MLDEMSYAKLSLFCILSVLQRAFCRGISLEAIKPLDLFAILS